MYKVVPNKPFIVEKYWFVPKKSGFVCVCRYSTSSQQVKLSRMMWKIWPYLPDYGRRAAQFVDLLGYFAIKCESNTEEVHFICTTFCFVLFCFFCKITCRSTSLSTMNPLHCTGMFETDHFTWDRVTSDG